MGCGSSNATSSVAPKQEDFSIIARQINQTWPDIKKINRLGTKTFAYLLYKHPEYRSVYQIPEAYKTEADLLTAPEVESAGAGFFEVYSAIIEQSETNFETIVREKATELNEKGIRLNQVKVYGESLLHVIKYEMKDDFNPEERLIWQIFTKNVSDQMALELAKFPRKSIV